VALDVEPSGRVLRPADHPISVLLYRSKDFRRPEAMADALLHPKDRAYAVPKIYAWFDGCACPSDAGSSRRPTSRNVGRRRVAARLPESPLVNPIDNVVPHDAGNTNDLAFLNVAGNYRDLDTHD
jgi:hypothetical protein